MLEKNGVHKQDESQKQRNTENNGLHVQVERQN